MKKTKKQKKEISLVPKLKNIIEENKLIPQTATVLEFHRETNDLFTIKIDFKAKHDPGQFVMLSIPGIGEAPISISSYSDKYMELTIRQVGNMTNNLANLKVGDKVLVRGPYGKGYPMHYFAGNSVIIIGGGCGVAPLRGIIDYIKQNRKEFKEVMLFLGYRSPEDIAYKREKKEWEKEYNLNVSVDKNVGKVCFDGFTGFITDLLKQTIMDNEKKIVFICGPPMMMKLSIQILKEKGFNDDQIYISAERLMQCGLGICGHCMIQGKYTCADGPVFRYDELAGEENK